MYNRLKRIGFIILTWNSEKCIGSCLGSIFSLESSKVSGRIVVIDNCSTDQTESEIQRLLSIYEGKSGFTCELHKLGKNYGTTVSRNIGIQRLINADVEFICILDSDTVINSDAIITLARALDKDDTMGIVGPRMKDRDNVYQHSGRNIPTLTEKILKIMPAKMLREKGEHMELSISNDGIGCVPVGYLLSACWMMRRDLPKEIGFLDEKIFYAPEDVEYCIRCQKAGYSVQYCYDAQIIHEWQRLSRKKLFSKHNFEHIKGLAYLFRKYEYLFSTKRLEIIFKESLDQRKLKEGITI